MRDELTFIISIRVNNNCLEEVEEEGEDSQKDGKDVIVVAMQSHGAGNKLRLVDVVAELEVSTAGGSWKDSLHRILVHGQADVGINHEVALRVESSPFFLFVQSTHAEEFHPVD